MDKSVRHPRNSAGVAKEDAIRSTGKLPRVVLLAIPVVVVVILMGWLLLRPPSITDMARDLNQAMMRGDTHTIYRWGFDDEKQANQMDEAKFAQFWSELIAPRLALVHPTGKLEVQLLGAGDEGFAGLPVADAAGHKYELDVTVWRTDSGPRATLTDCLQRAWNIESIVVPGKRWSNKNIYRAYVDGLRKDRPRLEQMGIHELVTLDYVHGVLNKLTLDEALSRAEKKLAELEARPVAR